MVEKKKDLREICHEKYGNDFVELYDLLSSGVPIGNFDETIIILNMIEAARKELFADGRAVLADGIRGRQWLST